MLSPIHSSTPSFQVSTDEFTTPPRRRRTTETLADADDSSFLVSSSGPSPKRNCLGDKSQNNHLNTFERVQKRTAYMESRFDKDQIEPFRSKKEQLENNDSLKSLINQNELGQRIRILKKSLQKKCFTIAEVILFKDDNYTLKILGSKLLKETFWSSGNILTINGHKFLGVLKDRIRSATGSKKPYPLIDFHSERACMMYLSKKIHTIVREILKMNKLKHKEFEWRSTTVHVNMITKSSSCKYCTKVFGLEENSSRIPDEFLGNLIKLLKLNDRDHPEVTISHQGLRHHHPRSKHKKELPKVEFYRSSPYARAKTPTPLLLRA